jgi:Protein of unknown function (DUF2442)
VGHVLHDVTEVKVLGPWRLHLVFDDGLSGEVDVSDLKDAGPIFEQLSDPAYFARVRVDPELGTVVWPNGVDLATEDLYDEVCENSPPSGANRRAKAGKMPPKRSRSGRWRMLGPLVRRRA